MNPPSWPAILIATGAFLLLGFAVSSFLRSLRRAARIVAEAERAAELASQAGNPPHEVPEHGGLLKTVRVYACGRTVVLDHRTRTKRTIPCGCAPHVDWDAELKDLTS